MRQRDQVEKEFLEHVKDHQLEVLHDDGVFRHLHFSKNRSSVYHFRITTWPGSLCIDGDMGTLVFQRTEDMFMFFRTEELNINTGYWGEKCKAGEISKWSPEAYEENIDCIISTYKERCDHNGEEVDKDIIEDIELLKSDSDDQFEAMTNFRDNKNISEIFPDWWEMTFTQKTYHFIWCLYAINWGIRKYDELKSKQEQAA